MKDTKEAMYQELGRWVMKAAMKAAMLKQALGDQQQETARMAVEVGSPRKQHKKLSQTAVE